MGRALHVSRHAQAASGEGLPSTTFRDIHGCSSGKRQAGAVVASLVLLQNTNGVIDTWRSNVATVFCLVATLVTFVTVNPGWRIGVATVFC